MTTPVTEAADAHQRQVAGLEREAARLLDAVRGADPTTPVPNCPGWTLADLTKHVGQVHRRVRTIVAERRTSSPRLRDVPLDLPADPADYAEWLAAGATRLVATLRATDADAPVWSWGPDQRVHFWSRRMWHETLMHRLDAAGAVGPPPDVAVVDAVDCLEELLGVLPYASGPSQRLPALGAAGETIHVHATDTDGEWLITLRGDGFQWRRGHAKGDVALRGPMVDLLFVMYGRRPPESVATFGDQALLERWLAASAF